MKIFTPIFILLSTTMAFGQAILNPSFENWSTDVVNGYDTLDYWNAEFDYFNEDQPILKSKDAQDGDASVLLQTPTFGNAGISDNLAYGDLDEDALIGYFKTEIADDDSAEIKVAYIKKNGNEVTSSSLYIKETTSEWTFFQVQLQKTQNADSIHLFFTNTTTGKESKMWLDNISWGTYVNIADKKSSTKNLTVYPNPATTTLNIEGSFTNALVELVSLDGKVVRSISNVNNSLTSISVAGVEPGVYLIKVNDESTTSVKRVIIK